MKVVEIQSFFFKMLLTYICSIINAIIRLVNWNLWVWIGVFMKVEFIVNTDINEGRQIFIEESEFRKAKNNGEEYDSFAFAKNCLF